MLKLWEKCKRRKTNELYHSEYVPRLGLCSLVAIGGVLILSTVLFAILPNVFAVSSLHSPPLASVVVAGLLLRFTASQLTWMARSTPKNGLLYNFAFVLNSEGLGFFIAWSQLLDGLSLVVILTQTLSDHINLLFDVNLNAQLRIDFNTASLVLLRVDAISIIILWLSAIIMCCSLRVLTTVSIVFLVVTLFTSTSTSVVALLHNIAHLKIKYIDFPYGYDEVLSGCGWLLLAILCLETLSFTSEEVEHPRKVLPLVFPALSKMTTVLILLSVLAFFPFAYRSPYTHESLLPATFNTIGIFSARYLMNVGSICGLSAAVMASFLHGSRLLCALASDKLIPGFLTSSTYGKGGSCRITVILIAFLVSLLSVVHRQSIGRLLPLNICVRLCVQAFLVYKSSFMPEQTELNRVPSYDPMLPSNRSSIVEGRSLVDEYSFGLSVSSTDDEEDDLIMERLWRVDGNECESSFSQTQEDETLTSRERSGASTFPKPETAKEVIPHVITKLDTHNCLSSSCADSQRDPTKKWPRFHIYEGELVEPTSVVLRKHSNSSCSDSDKILGRAMRFAAYFMFLSSLIAISHKIIRETKDFVPILPVVTLVVSTGLEVGIFVSTYITRRNMIEVEKQRYLPCECLASLFILCQFLFNFSLFNYLIELGWLSIGFVIYVLFSLKELRNR